MTFPRLSILQGLFGPFQGNAPAREAAKQMGRRWRKALARDPELRHDLIALGGLYTQPPVNMVNGFPQAGTMDLYQCGREAGRGELARQLLALGGLTIEEFNTLMEDDHDEQ